MIDLGFEPKNGICGVECLGSDDYELLVFCGFRFNCESGRGLCARGVLTGSGIGG